METRGEQGAASGSGPDPGPRTPGSGAEWVVGFHSVLGALEGEPARVEVVWLGEGLAGARIRRVLQAARAARVRSVSVPRGKLEAVAAGSAHNGFAARLAPFPMADADDLLAPEGPLCLLGLDGIEDGHNLGAVVRTAAALALGGVVVGGPHPPPMGGATAKVAAGTLSMVRVAHVGALGDFAARAKAAGLWVLGAEAGGSPIAEGELPDRLLLCLGGEGAGLRAKTRRALDGSVAVPLAPGVESLNLSVAAAILAWEWRRRYPGSGVRGPGSGGTGP